MKDQEKLTEEEERVHLLTDLVVPRIDLVRFPANLREFLVLKSKEGGVSMADTNETLDLDEVLEQEQNPEVEKEQADTQEPALENEAKAVELTDEQKQQLKDALKALYPLRDKFPRIVNFLGSLVGYPKAVETAPASPYPSAYPQPYYGYPSIRKAIEDKLSDLPDEVREQVLKAWDAEVEKTEKALAEQQEKWAALIKKAQEEAEELRKELDEHKRKLREREYVGLAKSEYSGLPGMKPEELGRLLMRAEESLGEEDYKKLTGLLKTVSKVIKSSALFEELGSALAEDSPERELETKAKELAKSENIPLEVAKGRILREDKALFRRLRGRGGR
ncbi:MAG: hypothetical protein DRJ03_24715 [Chloroflexi bacterium]|nr:MAG: hypothetical protein DRJ03_24715 [Chloroflexota bacterium]